MAHKTEGECPYTVNAIIRKRAKDENISLRKMVAITSKESGIPADTISRWIWPRKITAVKNDSTLNVASATSDKKPMVEETKPEIKKVLTNVIEIIKEKNIFQDDLKKVVDTIADSVEGITASAVLGHASRVHAKSGNLGIRPQKIREKSDVEKMVKTFHIFLSQLEKVRGSGSDKISKPDRETMDNEFKLMVPRALRLFDWIGVDLQEIVTNYVNRYKEVEHAKQDTKGLVGD